MHYVYYMRSYRRRFTAMRHRPAVSRGGTVRGTASCITVTSNQCCTGQACWSYWYAQCWCWLHINCRLSGRNILCACFNLNAVVCCMLKSCQCKLVSDTRVWESCDLFVYEHKICFERHGFQHYFQGWLACSGSTVFAYGTYCEHLLPGMGWSATTNRTCPSS